MNIIIIGVGALGSHLVQALRNENATLKVIDFDRVEMRNTASQFYFKNAVGKKKTEALKQQMQFCYGTKIQTIPNKLTDDNVEQLLSGADLLIDCLDNGEARRLVQDFAKAHETPCLHGALAADGGFGRVVWTESFVIDDGASGVATCEDGEFLPFIQLVVSYLATAAQQFAQNGRKLGFSISPTAVQKI